MLRGNGVAIIVIKRACDGVDEGEANPIQSGKSDDRGGSRH